MIEFNKDDLLEIFNTVPGLIIVADLNTHEILYINQEGKKRFGNVINKKCYKVLQGRDSPCEFCTNDIIKKMEGKPYLWEFYNKHIDRYYSLIDRVIKWGPNKEARLEIAIDITKIKKAERERRLFQKKIHETQKLESLGILTGGIAHDFNNLLMGILGNLSLLKMEIGQEREDIHSYLSEIELIAHRGADLTRQLLAYAGKGKFVSESLDLNRLIMESTDIIQAGGKKATHIQFHLTKDIPSIHGDRSQIQQVLLNLIMNAVEAIEEKPGSISISTGVRNCDEKYLERSRILEKANPGPYVFAEISDTGIGMTKASQAKMFDPFYTTKFAGRGLGLSAVLGIVKGHKGAIMVYSESQKGTTIKVLFPASDEILKEAPFKVKQQPPTEGTMLFVDDEPMIRKVGKKMLESLGYAVLLAANGKEAVEVFRKHRTEIRCIILDLTMPEMDGYEAFSRIRSIEPEVKIVLSSGYNTEELTQRFAGKNPTAFIQKPYMLDELAEKLEEVFEEEDENS